MRTQAQIEAARRNGAKSRGPITAEGKARSARNAVRHGLRSQTPALIEAQDRTGWAEILDDTIHDFQPATEHEHQLVADIAAARWRIARAVLIESAVGAAAPNQRGRRRPDPRLQAMLDEFSTVVRYETTLDRSYELAVAAFYTVREPEQTDFLERTRAASHERARQLMKINSLPTNFPNTATGEEPEPTQEPINDLTQAKPWENEDIHPHRAGRTVFFHAGHVNRNGANS